MVILSYMTTEEQTNKALLRAFHHAAEVHPFYANILSDRGVNPSSITSIEDFHTLVPILSKTDVFPKNGLNDLVTKDTLNNMTSAIVSSGTSGVFSYGVLTHADVEKQKMMLDYMLETFFDAKNNPPVVVNALAMGVSFVSSYPVIQTSVRSDIAREVILKFSDIGRPIIIICDPHFLKKLLEEGQGRGIEWSKIALTAIIGGTSYSDSLTQYLLGLLNNGSSSIEKTSNKIFGTMGVTEVGLNLFSATPDLIAMRHAIQHNDQLSQLWNRSGSMASPELMYMLSKTVHVEIINPNNQGIGDLVFTHLDTETATVLVRYKSGDRAAFIDRAQLEEHVGVTLMIDAPIVAVYGREKSDELEVIDSEEVKELLYRDLRTASHITGHFMIIRTDKGSTVVHVQIKPNGKEVVMPLHEGVEFVGVPYRDFVNNMELDYESKWKHSS